MNVVGLTGWAGSGKSTVANYLVAEHGYTRLSFAGPLKAMLRTLNPYLVTENGFVADRLSAVLHDVYDDEQAVKGGPYGKEYRRLLQALGTDCIRAHEPDFWVNAAINQMTSPDGLYVFDDVRFPNEAEVIKAENPWGLWNIKREGQELAADAHDSELHAGHMGEAQTLFNLEGNIKFLHESADRALRAAFSDTALLADAA